MFSKIVLNVMFLFLFLNVIDIYACPFSVTPNTVYKAKIDFDGEEDRYLLNILPDYQYFLIVWGPAQYGYSDGLYDTKAYSQYEMPDSTTVVNYNTDPEFWMNLGYGSFLQFIGVPATGPSDRIYFVKAPAQIEFIIARQDIGNKTGFYLFKVVEQPLTSSPDIQDIYHRPLSEWEAIDTSYPASYVEITNYCSSDSISEPPQPEERIISETSPSLCNYKLEVLDKNEIDYPSNSADGVMFDFKIKSEGCSSMVEQYVVMTLVSDKISNPLCYYLSSQFQFKSYNCGSLNDIKAWRYSSIAAEESLLKFPDYFWAIGELGAGKVCLYSYVDFYLNGNIDIDLADSEDLKRLKSACINFK